MAYLNKVMLIGNLGKDPEIRMTTTGRKNVSFSLATSRRYRDNNGETKEITDWHNIIGWGKVADIFESLNVRKGMSLFVEGTLSYRSWNDQQTGQKRSALEKVMRIDSLSVHQQRLQAAGFNAVVPCIQALNFVALLAFKA